MVYATTRRGYNPGGFNGANAPAGFEQYDAEIVTDYEIGAKYSWRNGPLRGLVSFDVYRDNIDNAQRNVTQPVNGNPVAYVANVARTEGHTAELQTLMRLSSAVFCLKKHNNPEYSEPRTNE